MGHMPGIVNMLLKTQNQCYSATTGGCPSCITVYTVFYHIVVQYSGEGPPNTFLVFSNAEVRLALLQGVLLAFGGDEDPENNREKAPWLHAGLRGNSIRAYES